MQNLELRFKGQETLQNEKAKMLLNQNTQEQIKQKPSLESFLTRDENIKLDESIEKLNETNKTEALRQDKNEWERQNEAQHRTNVDELNLHEQEYKERLNSQLQAANTLETPILSTGSKKLDDKIQERKLSLYDIYALRRMGVDTSEMSKSALASGVNLKAGVEAKVKRLNGDKDYEQIKELNNAFENLNSIVANSDETSGIQNNLARKWSNATNHFIFSADEGNQQRIFDEANLYGNYLNAIKLRSGGTQKERARMTEALNFGGLNAEQTRQKAMSIYENFFQRQNNALRVLKSKGYDEAEIFEALGEDGRNNFINNRKAYMYLKENEFNKDDFERVYKYGEFFKGGKDE